MGTVQSIVMLLALLCGAVVPNLAGYLNARRRGVRWSPFAPSFASFNAREWSVLAAGVAGFLLLAAVGSTMV